MASAFGSVLRRDLILGVRRRSELMPALVFPVIVMALFPLALRPEPSLLQSLLPAVAWVAVLLSVCLCLDTVFRGDFEDSSLEQIMLSPEPLALSIFAKQLACWLLTVLPLLLVVLVIAALFGTPTHILGMLALTMFLGTPSLVLYGTVAVALTVGLRQGSLLLSVLLLPLVIPVLVFATSAVAAASGWPWAELSFLTGMLLLALSLSPFLAAAALRARVS